MNIMYSIYKQLFNEKKKLSATQRFVFVVIIFSFFLIIIESENSIKSINPYIFEYLNIFLSYFFLTEYSLRLMCCGYTKKYKGFLGKIRFIFSFHSLIDLISFVPSLIFPGLNETFLFRIFRIFRMLKIIKLSNQLPAIKNVTQVLSKRKNEIFFSLFITIFIILIASIVLYLAEGKAQPEAFGSIIRSFWWSTITLTTIGYGDVYPITILGKIATTIIAIAGIGIVALPAGIIAGSFSEIVNKKK
jgi:voltage-gated potassium channel